MKKRDAVIILLHRNASSTSKNRRLKKPKR